MLDAVQEAFSWPLSSPSDVRLDMTLGTRHKYRDEWAILNIATGARGGVSC